MRPGTSLFAAALITLAATPSRGAGASNWRAYDTNDGLAESGCFSVTVGRHKVWVEGLKTGDVNGLDGYGITVIPPPGTFKSRIYESPGPQLWAVCEDGLLEFRDDKWLRYPVGEIAGYLRTNHSSAPDAVPLCPTKLGRSIFLLPDALMQLDVESPENLKVSTLRAATQTGLQTFLGMTVTPPNVTLWISGRRGLARVGLPRTVNPDTKWEEFSPPEALHLQNLREPVQDEEGGVTAVAETIGGGRKVIVHFDGQNWRTYSVGNENLRLGWLGPDKTLWAATSDSLFHWDEEHGEMIPSDDVSEHTIYDVAVEPGGIFWLAASDGLSRYTPPAWRTPSAFQKMNSPVHGITSGRDGRLWVASADALHLLQSNQWKTFSFPAGAAGDLSDVRVICTLGNNGPVVMQTGNSLFQFDPLTEQFTSAPRRAKTSVRAAGLLPDGTLCVQTSSLEPGGGPPRLEVYDGMNYKDFPYGEPPAGLGNELHLYSSPSGSLWLAGAKGIARLRDQKWQMFSPPGEKMPEGFTALVEITEDKIWCGFQDKIEECDGKTWQLVHAGLGHVNALLNGHDSGIWVACDDGLLRLYRDTWNSVGTEEGLPGAKVQTVFEDHGLIWAGTERGLSLYHPEADPDPPKTEVISSGHTDNKVPKGSVLTVVFSARDKWKFTPASRLLYSTRLDQQDWQPFQEGRAVTLTQLTPGEHFFQIQSMDRNWNKEPTPAKFDFTVVLPWYEERRLLLISSAGLAVALFFAALAFNRHRRLVRSYAEVEAKVALRTKQLERAGHELLHSQKMNALGTLAAGIAHDFNNILSIIKGSAQLIEDNLDNQEKVRIRTARIKTVVEQGAGIVKAMLGFTHGSGGELAMCDVNATLEETVKLLGDRFQREVEVQFAPAASLPQVPASRDFIQQILLNFIFNAAEAMTGQKKVILSVRRTGQLPANLVLAPATAGDYIFISVKDFGSGIPPDIMPRIFEPFFTTKSLSVRRGTGLGLSMVYELARQMGAGLAVESAVGQGSAFHLIIPVRDLPVDSATVTN